MTLAEFQREAARAAREMSTTPRELQPLLRKAGLMMVSAAKTNIRTSTTPDGTPMRPLAFARPAGGSRPLNDRGLLGASISSLVTGLLVIVGTNRIGCAIHQFGGLIRAIRAKFLTIPLTKEASRVSARNFPGTLHAVIAKGGQTGVLVDAASGGRGRMKVPGRAQYALVKQVIVPARPYLGFGKRLLVSLDALFAEHQARRMPGGA